MLILLAKRPTKSIASNPQQRAYGGVDLGVRQSTFSILYKHQNRKAFFTGCDSGPAVDVEEPDVVYNGRSGFAQSGEQFLRG
jgi:hypothetical protein